MDIKDADRVDIPGVGERELPRPLPLAWELVHVAFAVVAAGLAWALMPGMPERVAVHFDMAGNANGWIPKGPAVVVLSPAIIVILAACLAFCHLALLRAKCPDAEASPAAAYGYAALARAQSIALVGLGALYDAALLLMPLQMAGLVSVDLCMGALIAASLAAAAVCIWISVRYGAYGRRVARRLDTDAPQLASDDAHWTVWGLYRNADDPSLWVTRRYGMGITINAAHPAAWLQLAALIAVLVALGLTFSYVLS